MIHVRQIRRGSAGKRCVYDVCLCEISLTAGFSMDLRSACYSAHCDHDVGRFLVITFSPTLSFASVLLTPSCSPSVVFTPTSHLHCPAILCHLLLGQAVVALLALQPSSARRLEDMSRTRLQVNSPSLCYEPTCAALRLGALQY